jgi:hypothetical protein
MADIEELVDLVIAGQHPNFRARCLVNRIKSVLEDTFGAYDAPGVRAVLADRRNEVDAKLAEAHAAPPLFLSLLAANVTEHTAGGGVSSTAAAPAAPSSVGGSSAAGSSAGGSSAGGSSALSGAKPTASKEVGIGHFFGGGTKLSFSKGVLTGAKPISAADLSKVDNVTAFPCGKCGKSFGNSGARATHERACKAEPPATPADATAHAAVSTAAAGLSEEAAATTAAAATDATAAQDDEEAAPPPGKEPKLRKSDGKQKQTGLQQGAHRATHTLYFKLEVVKTYRRFQRLEKMGAVPTSGPNKWRGAGLETSKAYNGLAPSDISKWQGQEEALRTALTHEHRVGQKKMSRMGQLATSFSSRGARRMSLHPGRAPPFAACEVQLHSEYRAKRLRGERVLALWFRIRMKQLIRQYCGDEAADGFKASRFWMHDYSRRFGISLRRKSNAKSEPVEVRLPKLKRWHARLRRRLMARAMGRIIDEKWGRWLPRNRLSHDQVGINLREGLQHTYDEKGAKRVWIAGSPADDGKRFATLNITSRAVCDESKPRRGQPKLSIT